MVNIGNAPNDIDDINDFWYALDQGGLLSDTISDNIDDAIKVRPYGTQPDGDLVGNMATGELFEYEQSLAANETFTSDWFDTDGFSAIEFFVQADAASQPDGVEIQFTDDVQETTPTVEATTLKTYDNIDIERGFRVYKTETNLDGVRFVFNNNVNPNNLHVIGTAKTTLSLDGANYVEQNELGENQIRVGNNPNAQGLSIGDPSSLFGDVVTIERTTLLDISSSFGTSTVTDEIETTGSAGVTQDPDPDTGEIVLSTGTTADSSIALRTAEYGRYTPGYSAQAGIGIRIPTLPTDAGSEARWGYFDEQNGFYWGYDGSQQELFVGRRSNGTETERIYRSEWNRNVVDDIIDRPIDANEGNIFQIDFSWYGYGIILFSIVTQTDNDLRTDTPTQKTVTVHAISVQGETSTTDPNQPLNVQAENGTSAEDFDVRVGGRQFSIFGDKPTGNRVTSETVFERTFAQDSWTHVMSWRRKQAGSGTEPNARLNLNGIDYATNQTSKVALVVNPILNNPTWGTPNLTDPDETLLEVTTTGTFGGLDGGTKIWESSTRVSSTGQAQTNQSPDVDLSLGQNNIVSLVVWGNGGSGNATSTLRFAEDW